MVSGSGPSFSVVAASRFEPVRVSASPARAGEGAAWVSFGTGLNTPLLPTDPPGVSTVSEPTGAAAGTFTTTFVAAVETIWPAAPPKETTVVPASSLPLIDTDVPATPEVGVKPVI